jgi:glyoxylase-like metal-dependent hydrolase (beta-lactamase superfamily II)
MIPPASRPRVYIINEPLQKGGDGMFHHAYDITPAARFGDLVYVLPAGRPPFYPDPEPMLALMKRRMRDVGDDDFLVMIGHPTLIAWASAIMAGKTGGIVRTLHWQNRTARYVPTVVDVNITEPEVCYG